MERHSDNFINSNGKAVQGAKVEVRLYPGGALAVLYSDNGLTTMPNPTYTDALGAFYFYAADGRYALSITSDTTQPVTRDDILLEDPVDGPNVTTAALAGDNGFDLIGGTWFGGAVAKVSALASSIGASLIGFVQAGVGAIVRAVQDKLRESVSVIDFGAVGDGAADDIEAFEKAILSGAAVVRIPYGKTYRLSRGIVVPSGVQIKGDAIFCSNIDGAGPTGTVLRFDSSVAICVTIDGRTSASGGGAGAIKSVVVSRAGTPPADSIGVLTRGAYNSMMEDVFSHNHAIGFKWLGRGGSSDPSLANGLGSTCTRLYTGAISDCHFLIDSWPELRVTGGRSGMNGVGDVAGVSFVRITSPVGGSGGAGPNTIVFVNYQFNQGGTAGPSYFVEFTNNTAGVGNQVIYQFTNCHVENITAAYIKSYSSAAYLQKLQVIGGSLNTAVPLFALDAATSINNVGFAGVDISASTLVIGSNYVNGLNFTGSKFSGCVAALTAPPTNNWNVAFAGNTWANGSSLTLAGTGWASCVVNDAISFDSTVADNTGSRNVSVPLVKRNVASWTPAINIGGATTGITYTSVSGVYQLSGRVVTLDFKIQLSSKGAGTGAVTITGLPFAPAGVALDGHSGACGYVQNCTLTGAMTVRVANTSSLELRQSSAAGNSALTDSALANNSVIYGSLSYFI